LENGKPEVVVYFNEAPYTPRTVDELEQNAGVLKFRAGLKGLTPTYTGPDDFKDKIREYFAKYLVANHPLNPGEHTPARLAVLGNPEPYVRALRDETAIIDVQGFKYGDKTAVQLPIGEFYIPLTTAGVEGGEHGAVPLERALAQRKLLVVGDPGAGKSTFLRRVAHDLGTAWEPGREFPIWISAAVLWEYIAGQRKLRTGPADPASPDWIPLFLAQQCTERHCGLSADYFREVLRAGVCRVLIDGLDEGPDLAARESLAKLIGATANACASCKFVVTSRPEGKAAIVGFQETVIADLEPAAIQWFLGKLATKLYEQDSAKAEAFRKDLQYAVDARAEIRKMARNPVMLTALAVLQHNQVKLPEKQVDLYASILDWLAKSRKREGRLAPAECLLRLRELAFEMQNHAEGRRKQVRLEWAGDKLKSRFGSREKAQEFLRAEQADSGIVVSRGPEVAFWHLTFQEFLAAAEIAGWEDADQHALLVDQGKLYGSEWRQTALLFGGLLHNVGPRKVDALFRRLLDKIGPQPPLADRARCVGLIGAMMRDLVGYGVSDGRYAESLRLVMDIFDPVKSQAVPFEDRLAAAEALGQAGDPRVAEFEWVAIPRSDNYRFGATKAEDPDADDNEKPHVETVEAFRITKYPVTVSQYGKWVEEGGEKPEHWEEQLEHPTRPVVIVTWHQATAFAEWANSRLPTEWEWERAARGPQGTKYPWGNERIDATRANFEDSGVGHPTPVGLYPLGVSAEGVLDLIGNVFEWTSTEFERCKVLRGVAYWCNSSWLRSSFRLGRRPESQVRDCGFRLAGGFT
ncbi:MAG: NACHT domain-containing protein, partial [Acidobacteria bacterium]|nr:NACHT domain-containing protein [Acidobacteriota bacterium]